MSDKCIINLIPKGAENAKRIEDVVRHLRVHRRRMTAGEFRRIARHISRRGERISVGAMVYRPEWWE